jgi:hypothetical protein
MICQSAPPRRERLRCKSHERLRYVTRNRLCDKVARKLSEALTKAKSLLK